MEAIHFIPSVLLALSAFRRLNRQILILLPLDVELAVLGLVSQIVWLRYLLDNRGDFLASADSDSTLRTIANLPALQGGLRPALHEKMRRAAAHLAAQVKLCERREIRCKFQSRCKRKERELGTNETCIMCAFRYFNPEHGSTLERKPI